MAGEQFKPAPLPQDLQQTLDQRASSIGFHATLKQRSYPAIGYVDHVGTVDEFPAAYVQEKEHDEALLRLDEIISAHQLWARRLLGEPAVPFPAAKELTRAIGLPEEGAELDLFEAIIDSVPPETWGEVLEEEDDLPARYRTEKDPIRTFDRLRSLVDGRVQTEHLTPQHLFQAAADIYAVHNHIYETKPGNPSLRELDLEAPGEGCNFTIIHDVPRYDAMPERVHMAFYDEDHFLLGHIGLDRTTDGDVDVLSRDPKAESLQPSSLSPDRIQGIAKILLDGYISTPPQELQRTF